MLYHRQPDIWRAKIRTALPLAAGFPCRLACCLVLAGSVLFWVSPQAVALAAVREAVAGPSQSSESLTASVSPTQPGIALRAPAGRHEPTGPATGTAAFATPIYKAWYFYLALLFIGITLPAHIFRRRMELMKGRMGIILEERNRIARECHDTLMAGFAAVSWQLEATAKLFSDSNLESTPAAESCELARSMVAHCQAEARRIIWNLRETDEITCVLSAALTRSIEANRRAVPIETTLEVEGEEVQLPPVCVHHLVCIGQEAVTNAIRHAEPSRISIHLKYEPSTLCLRIRDNGRGFQAPARSVRNGHFGIAVMKERAEKIGGTFRIQALPGSGTEVTVEVPFNALRHPVSQGQLVVRWIGI